MKDTKKTEFPGKMDKPAKRTYKTTYKMGYGKLKHVKMFENFDQLNETGEWSRDMDLQQVKRMTDDEIGRDDEASWIKGLYDMLTDLKVQGGVKLDIIDIKGFDKYQGPYAMVDFKKHGKYKVWTAENDELFIEGWPDGNNDRGFVGTLDEIKDLLS